MDRKESLQAVLDGETIDRVPCAFRHHYAPECSHGEKAVQAHLDFFREAPCDVFKVMNEHMFRIDEDIAEPGDWRKVSRHLREDPESVCVGLQVVADHVRRRGAWTILHICKAQVRLPVCQGIDADIINWDVHDCLYGLREGRKLFPGKTLLGGFDDRSGVLVEADKAGIVREAGRNRFILGADCTLPETIEPWRIDTVTEKAKSPRSRKRGRPKG